MNIKVRFLDSAYGAVLTTDHARSSYGQPVLIPGFALGHHMREDCYGPGDLMNEVPLVLDGPATADEITTIKAAGFNLIEA